MEKITLTVTGMTCMGCVRSVKNVVEPIAGVSNVEINLENGHVSLSYDPAQAPLELIKNAINDAGYEVIA